MEIFKTRADAERAKRISDKYNESDMIIKVDGGFVVMSARAYINWLVNQ